jgi:hypothetical protein
MMGLRSLKFLLSGQKVDLMSLKDQKSEKGRTSEELAEVRSVGTSLEAGVTFVSLGLSLLNNFRMGKTSEKGRGQGRVGGRRGMGMGTASEGRD